MDMVWVELAHHSAYGQRKKSVRVPMVLGRMSWSQTVLSISEQWENQEPRQRLFYMQLTWNKELRNGIKQF